MVKARLNQAITATLKIYRNRRLEPFIVIFAVMMNNVGAWLKNDHIFNTYGKVKTGGKLEVFFLIAFADNFNNSIGNNSESFLRDSLSGI